METLKQYQDMCYNAAVCVEQRLTDANEDANTDVGIAEGGTRQWLTLVWHEWHKQVWRERLEKATGQAWTAPARIDALVKHEPGGHND